MKKENSNNTTNSKAYKLLRRVKELGCPICGPHSGCNSGWWVNRNWKAYRKTQWK